MSEMFMIVSNEQSGLEELQVQFLDENAPNTPPVVAQYAGASLLINGRMVDGVPGPEPVAIKPVDDRVF